MAAFIGRSNVGKSSLINMISNRKGIRTEAGTRKRIRIKVGRRITVGRRIGIGKNVVIRIKVGIGVELFSYLSKKPFIHGNVVLFTL